MSIELLFILLFIIGCLIIRLKRLSEENKINYSNYRNCLLALSEYDKGLSEYLERRDEKNGRNL